VTPDVQISWATVSGASGYRVQIGRDSLFQDLVADTSLSDTSLALSGLQHMRRYFWRVKGTSDTAEGTWRTQDFRVFGGKKCFNVFKAGDVWVYSGHNEGTSQPTSKKERRIELLDVTNSGDSVSYMFLVGLKDTSCYYSKCDTTFVIATDTVIFRASTGEIIRIPTYTTPLLTYSEAFKPRGLYVYGSGQIALAAITFMEAYGRKKFVEGFGMILYEYGHNGGGGYDKGDMTLMSFNGIPVPQEDFTNFY
jgi:hypothetical protein